jgi:hypothetical protein
LQPATRAGFILNMFRIACESPLLTIPWIIRIGQLRRRNICWQCFGILTDSRSWQSSRNGYCSTGLGS